jgi:pre-rRNA-processing protein IPI3
MEETAFYIAEGNPADKHSQESFALATSLHTSQQYASFRQADCPRNGAVLTGTGPGERLFVASKSKALLQVYSWGKEGVDQRIPIPEPLSCLTVCYQPKPNVDDSVHKVPSYRVPWLLAGGSSTGRIYIWELASGNLVCVKDAHYQTITTMKFSHCGTFLVTGSDDARCLIWKTVDLISIYEKDTDDHLQLVKPFHSISDNTLPVTDLVITPGSINDIKLYTVSKDSTLRLYSLMTKTLITTFVLPGSIECLTVDPANRSVYVGLSNGKIRAVPLYHINSNSNILESIGGNSKIITVANDPDLQWTFVHHQQQQSAKENSSLLHKSLSKSKTNQCADMPISITTMEISMDGTTIVSGDSLGRVFVADIVTKQIVKSFTPCNSPISYIRVDCMAIPISMGEAGVKLRAEKKARLIPPLKRVLASNEFTDHVLSLEISEEINCGEDNDDFDGDFDDNFDAWLNEKRQQNLEFKNLSTVDSTVKRVSNGENITNRTEELETKLATVSKAYTELRAKHEQLLNTHTSLLNESKKV